MSSDPEFSLIQNNYDDILLRIFTFNADMLSDRQALHTTCITSQVCRQWRGLMLGTTALWARLIDMDQISKRKTHEWREELVRRGGDAPLWIRTESSGRILSGPESPHDKYIVQFFFNLVRSNFHRIQKLLIVGEYSKFELTRSMLNFPAPQLEYCELSFRPTNRDRDQDMALFADHAPMLRIFHFRGCAFDCRAPWLGHIHSIVLDRTYHILDALAVLSETHNLQELKIESISNFDMTTHLPILSLSHLKYLEYNGYSNRTAVATLMDHIQIPVDCSLIIHTGNYINRTNLTEEKLSLLSIINKFTQHAEGTLKSGIFNHIDLVYDRKYAISFTCGSIPPSACQLSISIPLSEDSDASLLGMFLQKLVRLDFTSVTKLDFTANGRLNTCFGPLFSRLQSVERISVDLKALSHLAHLQKKYIDKATNKPVIVFPILQKINLSIHTYPSRSIFFVNPVAATFLLWRLNEGHPISMLDMSKQALDLPPNLDALAEVKGLKVLYRLSALDEVVEYRCGNE